MLKHFIWTKLTRLINTSLKSILLILLLLGATDIYARQQVKTKVAQLVRGKVISILWDKTNIPSNNIKVTLHYRGAVDSKSIPMQTVFTGQNGLFYFENVPFGKYIIAIWRDSESILSNKEITVSKSPYNDIPPLYFGPNKDFKPINLSYDEKTNTLYTLSAGFNAKLYKMDLGEKKFSIVESLTDKAEWTDQCLVQQEDYLLAACLAVKKIGSSRRTLIKLSVLNSNAELKTKPQSLELWGYFAGLTYDSQNSRLLFTDFENQSVNALKLNSAGIDPNNVTVFSGFNKKSELGTIFLWNNFIYMGDLSLGKIYRLDLKNNSLKTVVEKINRPLAISLSRDKSNLLIADGEKERIINYNLKTGSNNVFTEISNLQYPTGVIEDKNGSIWIADHDAHVLYEFTKDGKLKQYFP